jgi:hypothetical protein
MVGAARETKEKVMGAIVRRAKGKKVEGQAWTPLPRDHDALCIYRDDGVLEKEAPHVSEAAEAAESCMERGSFPVWRQVDESFIWQRVLCSGRHK